MIERWLKAGMLDKRVLRRTMGGKPQDGVISPLLSNIYLHHVLDRWSETGARPYPRGHCLQVRYADDAVMAFENHAAGMQMLALLGERLGRHGITLHPTKTRLVGFWFRRPQGCHPIAAGTTFDFIGFTHEGGNRARAGTSSLR